MRKALLKKTYDNITVIMVVLPSFKERLGMFEEEKNEIDKKEEPLNFYYDHPKQKRSTSCLHPKSDSTSKGLLEISDSEKHNLNTNDHPFVNKNPSRADTYLFQGPK